MFEIMTAPSWAFSTFHCDEPLCKSPYTYHEGQPHVLLRYHPAILSSRRQRRGHPGCSRAATCPSGRRGCGSVQVRDCRPPHWRCESHHSVAHTVSNDLYAKPTSAYPAARIAVPKFTGVPSFGACRGLRKADSPLRAPISQSCLYGGSNK
jgi:hypothetical protein